MMTSTLGEVRVLFVGDKNPAPKGHVTVVGAKKLVRER